MGTLSARNLRESLQKARNVGIVEERLTLFGEVELVVRNLRPDEYEAIQKECADQEGLDYLYAFQEGHVKRAIVELNGQDLRDVQFVEDEEEDPKKPGTTRTVKLELADWLQKNFLSTWGKEAVYVAFRKVEDAVGRAEKRANEGIEFITPDETNEDKLRRVVGELKELEDNLPAKLLDNVLDENGFMRKSTADEVKRAMEKADALARETAAKDGTAPPAPPAPPPAAAPVTPPAAAPVTPAAPPPPAAAAPGVDPSELMRNRQPMNQAAADVPQPFVPTPRGGHAAPTPAVRNAPPGPPPPEQVHPPIGAPIPGPQLHGGAAIRSAKHAALEADADAAGALAQAGSTMPERPADVPVIEKRQAPIDPKAVASVLDPQPRGGINPHYRPRPRGV